MIKKLRLRFTLLVWITLLIIMAGVVTAVNLSNWHSLTTQAETALETLCSQDGARPTQAVTTAPPVDENGAAAGDIQPGSTPPPMDENGAATGDIQPGSTPPPVDENGAAAGTQPSGGVQPGSIEPPADADGATPGGGQGGSIPSSGSTPSGSTDPGASRQSAGQASASLSNYYTVKLDHDGALTSWSSDRADLYTDDGVAAFTAQVLAAGTSSGRIGSQFYRLQDEPYGSMLIVLDMQLEILNAQALLRTTLFIGLSSWLILSLGAFFLIKRLIRPVQVAFDRQRQFVWDASHELKTPLAVISANADALSRDVGDSEWLTYIHAEIDRATNMINSMLTLAQLDQGALRARMQPFDLSRAVTGVLLPFESVVFEAGKTLVSDVPDGISITGDEAMLSQLVSILLGNAVKYADAGGTITVKLRASGHHRVLTVHNTGEGVSPRDQAHLFERFYRADASHNSKVEGHGLGLAIAKSLVDLHHGRIAVDCPPEGGTRFTVTLP